jgi:hypothetical protein
MQLPLTQDELKRRLRYEPETGEFYWLVTRSKRRFAGKRAGRTMVQGYCIISIDKRSYYAHRLAWLYVHGRWPTAEIDHINDDPADNRLANLREATHAENIRNSRQGRWRSPGMRGVIATKGGAWRAQIKVNGRNLHLGTFKDLADAQAARRAAAELHHREFARI